MALVERQIQSRHDEVSRLSQSLDTSHDFTGERGGSDGRCGCFAEPGSASENAPRAEETVAGSETAVALANVSLNRSSQLPHGEDSHASLPNDPQDHMPQTLSDLSSQSTLHLSDFIQNLSK